MNLALIFAGGVGQRMGNNIIPKQFLEYDGKSIIAYTIEHFQKHKLIDAIILVSLETYIDKCKEICDFYGFNKVKFIIKGGISGQESIYNGLKTAIENYDESSIVLIHDGVRPIITEKNITDAIYITTKKGNAIPVTNATDTIAINSKDDVLGEIIDRKLCVHAKAPQSFILKEIYNTHCIAKSENKQFIDSASMMQYYGKTLYTFACSTDNIKITTPIDFYVFKGLIEKIKGEKNENR